MKHSIPYYIREQLREDKSVSIPGLGKFILTHNAANVSIDKTEILPPTLSLTFSEESGDEQPLLNKISSVENFSLAKASKKLKKYTESLFNNLININKAEINGVGVLVRDDDKDISFKDTVASLTDEYQGLKPILLRPIKRMTLQSKESKPATDNQILIENSSQISETKRYRPWWIPLIGGLILFSIYLISLKTCNNNSGFLGFGADSSENVVVDSLSENSDSLNETSEATYSDDLIEENTEIISLDNDSDDGSINNEEVNDNNNTDNKENVGIYDEIDYSKSTESGHSIIQSIDYDGEQCVIIVGSFKKAKNVLKMQTKVENLGYDVFTEYYGDFTRVGLKFSCKEDQLDLYIQEARQKLDGAAWYLYTPGN